MKTTEDKKNRTWNLIRNNFAKMCYTIRQNHRMKTFYQEEEFFEKDFERIFKYSLAMQGNLERDELIANYIDYFKNKIKELEKKYVPEAQILVNSKRYLKWLERQLQVDEESLKHGRLKVLCPTRHFGYIMNELIYNGYLDAPMWRGEVNLTACSRIIKRAFLILQEDGVTEVSDNHFKDEINAENASIEVKNRIRIPRIND